MSQNTSVEYDARQRFYDEVMARLARTAEYADRGDLRSWYLELHNLYNMICPYLGAKARNRLENGDEQPEPWLVYGLWRLRDEVYKSKSFDGNYANWNPIQQHIAKKIEKELLRIGAEIMIAGKHLWLPTGDTEESDEWDSEKFKKKSGLT